NLVPLLETFNNGTIELPKSIIVQWLNTKFDLGYVAGKGLDKLYGLTMIKFEDGFNVSFDLPDQPKISLKVDKEISLHLDKQGLTTINGIKVDLPGPFDPSIKAILIEDNKLAIKGSFPTQYTPLPPELAKLLE